MERTWRPKTAGILSIVAGLTISISSMLLIGYGMIAMLDIASGDYWGFWLFHVGWLSIIIGIIAVVGGIFSLIRRIWWIALAGSICAIICFFPLGIPSIIFIVKSKGEFV